jgi:hypothetical protein
MKPIPIAQYLNRFERAEPTNVEAPRRQNALTLMPRVVPIAEDVETRLREAFEKGRQEGLAAARVESAAALASQRDEQDKLVEAERLVFQANEYAKLAEQISGGLIEIEDRIAATVARILRPYLTQEHATRITKALSDNLARILSGESAALLKISGPENLLNILRERLSKRHVQVEYSFEDGVDVTIETQQTVVQSQLQAWIDLIESTAG